MDGKRFLAKDVLSSPEAEHCILVMVGMWRSNIDHIHGLSLHQFFIGCACFSLSRAITIFEELSSSLERRRRSCGPNDVLDIRNIAGRRFNEKVFRKGY